MEILRALQRDKKLNISDGILRLRVGGDGSQVARSKNITNVVLSVLNSNMESCRQDSNIHTLLLLDAAEDYETLATALKPLCDSMRDAQERGIELDGQHLKVEFFLAADYKFLAMVLGHKGAWALFNCLWYLANRNEWKQTLEKVKDQP